MNGNLKAKYREFTKQSRWFIDLIEDHPFEIGLSLALILFGVRALLTQLAAAPGSVQGLPLGVAYTYCALSVMGGSATIYGLMAQVKYLWAYGIERFGLFVSASAWGAYIVGVVLNASSGNITLVTCALLALVIGCLLRARKVNRKAKARYAALKMLSTEKGL